jgi:glycine/D-amino acid oxidase-like deaminating enzyme/nitrite reductase/ring-hydroxylating ferredoxin subunit
MANTANESLWLPTAPRAHQSPLAHPVEVDVVVVGGGLAGMTAALLLKRRGVTVAVLEMQRVGLGETGHTTAHLTELVDTRYEDIERDFGRDAARLVAASSRAAIDHIEAWSAEFPCDFERVPGYLYAEGEGDVRALQREVEAARLAGVAAEFTREVPLPFAVAGALRVGRQAQFHPMRYLRGLARELPGHGCHLFEESRVVEVSDGEPCRVTLASGVELRARSVLVTAHVPVFNLLALHTKIAAYRTYAVATRSARLPPLGLYWDTADPYHYTRRYEDERGPLLIVGGEDHKTGQCDDTEEAFARLKAYARDRFGAEDFRCRWSGQVIEPADGLPYIGRNSASDNVFVATGFSGNGMTFGTVAGLMLADAAQGIVHPWAELYEATRMKLLGAVKDMLVENVDYPVHLIGDRLAVPARTAKDLSPGEGDVVVVGGRRLAVYCDERGTLHGLSPTCTHMGCHVSWNTAERSWDCPCHGGRFDALGAVLNGPPLQPLASVPLDEPEPVLADSDETFEPAGALTSPAQYRVERVLTG